MLDALRLADDVLRQGVQGICDLVTVPGLINLDLADVRTIMTGAGTAHMGIGGARGEGRAQKAAEMAINSSLLETSIDGARGILLNISGGSDLSLYEVNEVAEIINSAADPEANIIFGAVVDESLGDHLGVTVVAAGFENKPRPHVAHHGPDWTGEGKAVPGPAWPAGPGSETDADEGGDGENAAHLGRRPRGAGVPAAARRRERVGTWLPLLRCAPPSCSSTARRTSPPTSRRRCASSTRLRRAGRDCSCSPRSSTTWGRPRAWPPPRSRSTDRLLTACADAAKRHGVYLVAGSIWESIPGDERTYNTSVLFGPEGERLALYRKIHMFDVEVGGQVYRESDSCRPGDRVVAVRLDPGASGRPGHGQVTLGLSICYDLRFPELFRALLDLGSHVITMPSAFTMATGRDHWQVLVRARAIENQLFMVAANQTGTHAAGLESYGRSLIVDPWGVVLGQVADGVGVAVADLDLHRLAQVRRMLPALRHRVPEAYLRRDIYEHGEVVEPDGVMRAVGPPRTPAPTSASRGLTPGTDVRGRTDRRRILRLPLLLVRLGCHDARPQRFHQVDYFASRGFGGHSDLLARDLGVDHSLERLAVVVVEGGRVPGLGQVLDEALGHGHLLGPEFEAAGGGLLRRRDTDLVGPEHRLEHQEVAQGPDQRKVLLLVERDLGHRGLAGLGEHAPQELVRLATRLVGHQIVGPLVEHGVDFGQVDELGDLDGAVGAYRHGLQVGVAQHHVMALGVLVTADDVLEHDLLAARLAHAVVAHPPVVGRVQLMEADGLLLGGRVHADRDRDEAELYRAFPHGLHCSPPVAGVAGGRRDADGRDGRFPTVSLYPAFGGATPGNGPALCIQG